MSASNETSFNQPPREPELLIAWQPRSSTLWTCVCVLLTPIRGEPEIPAQLRLVRQAWFTPQFPLRAMLTSLLLHLLILVLPLPSFGGKSPAREKPLLADHELTWIGPSDVLPPIEPLREEKKKPAPGGKPKEPLPPEAEEVFRARQRIISFPARPDNTLLRLEQPDLLTPQLVKPKPLPNIVLWAHTPLPPVPQLELAVKQIAQPKLPLPVPKPAELPANLEPNVAPVNMSSRAVESLKPKLVVPPSRTAGAAMPGDASEAPSVNLPAGPGSADHLERLIALSASPAPLAPVIEVPPGNLSAQFSLGPMAGQNGSPGGVPGGTSSAQGGTNGGPGGESGGAGQNGEGSAIRAVDLIVSRAPGTPPGLLAGTTGPGSEMQPPAPAPAAPRAPAKTERREIARASLPPRGVVLKEPTKPPAIEESILSGKKVYTLSINMPNLASRSGSWVLRFSELEENAEKNAGNGDSASLTGPVAVLKIDPKYSPDAVRERVEGQVVLYAIIRHDGKVEDVHVLRGVDVRLDQNAVEAFRRWQFVPARKAGVPVDLEAVVYIPFRLSQLF